jgi:hypothetical protein
MKKIILLSGILYSLASLPASAQIVIEYPHGREWQRQQSNHRYWEQVRINQEAEEHARKEDHDNGKHHAYGKDPKHHKEGWKDRPKRGGESYNKNRPHDPNKNYGKNGRNHHDNNR